MRLKYESLKLMLEKNRIRFTDKRYECIRNYDNQLWPIFQFGILKYVYRNYGITWLMEGGESGGGGEAPNYRDLL